MSQQVRILVTGNKYLFFAHLVPISRNKLIKLDWPQLKGAVSLIFSGWKTPETPRVLARKLSASCKLERIVIHELADHLQNVAAMDQSQYVIFWRLPIWKKQQTRLISPFFRRFPAAKN